jgi:hypothetical protein
MDDETKPPKPTPRESPPTAGPAREVRLAAALRANLRRRKLASKPAE